jgi:signal transduction histidine kinase
VSDGRIPATILRRVAHDVTGIGGVVRGATDELRRNAAAQSDAAEPLLAMLLRSAARLERLAGKLRIYGELAAGKVTPRLAPVDVEAAVRRATTEAEGAFARRGVTVETHVESAVPKASADPRLSHEVLVELVSNAITHTRTRVALTIERSPASLVHVIVEDDGPGFPAGFEEAFREVTAERTSHGLWIGFASAAAAAESMNAAIEIGTSKLPPGRATTPGARVILQLQPSS